MAVRTRQLAAGQGAASTSPTNVFTIPADRTAIVKDIVLQNVSGASAAVNVGLLVGGQPVPLWVGTMAHAAVQTLQERFVVMHEGDTLYVTCSPSGNLRWLISGTLLFGDPQ